MYDEIYSDIHDFMKEEYGSMIFEFYEDNVDDDEEDDDDDWVDDDDDEEY
jgi:hypothetical protein